MKPKPQASVALFAATSWTVTQAAVGVWRAVFCRSVDVALVPVAIDCVAPMQPLRKFGSFAGRTVVVVHAFSVCGRLEVWSPTRVVNAKTAQFWKVAGGALNRIVTLADCPRVIFPKSQVTLPADCVHLPRVVEAETKTAPAGSLSVTPAVTIVSNPSFVALKVWDSARPAVTGSGKSVAVNEADEPPTESTAASKAMPASATATSRPMRRRSLPQSPPATMN